MRADCVEGVGLMIFADEDLASGFDAFGEIGVEVHDDLAAYTVRAAKVSDD